MKEGGTPRHVVSHGRPAVAHQSAATTLTYYIAADSVTWDYTPTGSNGITGEPFDDVANVFVAAGPDRVGSAYVKSLYREYTDDTFSTLKERPPAWEHLGFLGPVIHAVVGSASHLLWSDFREKSLHHDGASFPRLDASNVDERPAPKHPFLPRRQIPCLPMELAE